MRYHNDAPLRSRAKLQEKEIRSETLISLKGYVRILSSSCS